MTLATSNRRVVYTGNGVTTVFPYTFKLFDSADLQVYKYTIATGDLVRVPAALYTVSGVGLDTFGSVTYLDGGSPLSSAYKLVLVRVMEDVQETDLSNQSAFFLSAIEDQFDKTTMLIQQLDERIDRSLRLSDGDPATSFSEIGANRANKYLGFDSAGLPTLLTGSGGGGGTSIVFTATPTLPPYIYGEQDGVAIKVAWDYFVRPITWNKTDITAVEASLNDLWLSCLPSVSVTPTVTGTLLTGQVLTANAQTWVGLSPFTYAYQWLRDGAEINGATATTYTLLAADQMTFISCEFAVTNAAGTQTYTLDYGWSGQLYTFYNDLGNAAWTKYQCTIASAATTTQRLLETAVNDLHRVRQDKTKAASAITYRFMAKVGNGLGRDWCHVEVMDSGGTDGLVMWFNMLTGAIGNSYTYGAGFSFFGAFQRMAATADGKWWITLDFTSNADTTISVRLGPASADNVNSYLGDVTKGMYIEQMVLGVKP